LTPLPTLEPIQERMAFLLLTSTWRAVNEAL
jgi:hypothetical protein